MSVVLIIFGVKVIITPKFYSTKYSHWFDFTGINKVFGGFLIVLGLCFLALAFTKKRKIASELICPRCEEVFHANGKIKKCPKCLADLEELAGFYDRHPGLEDIDKLKGD